MSSVAKSLAEWMNDQAGTLERLRAEVRLGGSGTFIDGDFDDALFRIVAWENGASELQIIRLTEKECFKQEALPSEGRTLRENHTQHHQTLCEFRQT